MSNLGRRAGIALALGLLLASGAAFAAGAGTSGTSADKVLVEKRAHAMTLFHRGEVLRTYRVALGTGGLGRKVREGDRLVPEGIYRIAQRVSRSGFHRALRISYPNREDRARAAALGVPPGGDVMIHGIKNGYGWLGPLHRLRDWTRGCIAVTDGEMDEIWRLVPLGTEVEIRP